MGTIMERILPALNIIQTRLREILDKNKDGMISWDLIKLRSVGDDLINLSVDVYLQLTSVGHGILYQSIKDAGLGIKRRVTLIGEREISNEDKEYFEGVYEALLNIYQKIESGEYYRALLEMVRKREEDNYMP
jgi:hypothetical protein